jgi:hypothetical protein
MIRIALAVAPDQASDLNDFLTYTVEKMSGERADSHDTATAANVIGEKISRAIKREVARGSMSVEVWVSNEFARAACRELSMFLGYASDQPKLRTFTVRRVRDSLDADIKRQDSEKWSRERAKAAKGRPTVREARRA